MASTNSAQYNADTASNTMCESSSPLAGGAGGGLPGDRVNRAADNGPPTSPDWMRNLTLGGKAAPSLPSASGRRWGRASRRDGIMPGRARRCSSNPQPGLPRKQGKRIGPPASTDWKRSLPPGRRTAPFPPLRLREGPGEGLPARRDQTGARPPSPPVRQQPPTRPPPQAGEEDRAADNPPTGSATFRLAENHTFPPRPPSGGRPLLSPPACGRGRGRVSRRDSVKPGYACHFRRGSRPPPGLPRKRGRRIGPPTIHRLEAQPSARQEDRLRPLPWQESRPFPPLPPSGRGRGRAYRGDGASRAAPITPAAAADPRPASPASGEGDRTAGIHRTGNAASRPRRRTFSSPPACGRGPPQREQAGPRPPLPPVRQQTPTRPHPQAGEEDRATDWKHKRPLGRKTAPFLPCRRAGHPLLSPPACGSGRGRAWNRAAPAASAAARSPRHGRKPTIHRLPYAPAAEREPPFPPYSPLPLAGGASPQTGEEDRAANNPPTGSATVRLAEKPPLPSPSACGRGRGRAFRRDGSKPGRASRLPPQAGAEELPPASTGWKRRLPSGGWTALCLGRLWDMKPAHGEHDKT